MVLDNIMIINLQCSITILAREYIHDVEYRDSKKFTFGNKIKSLAITIVMFA